MPEALSAAPYIHTSIPLQDEAPLRQLVLLGAGHAHVHLLRQMAMSPWIGVEVILVTPHERQLYSGMVPGLVAGRYALHDCVIPLEHFVRRSGIRWIQSSARSLDAASQTVTLEDGSSLHYDWLSINTGPVQNRDALEALIPGAREHALFVRPIEAFGLLWPQVAAVGDQRPLRIAVIGAGAAGLELAMAIRRRLPSSAVTLLSGDAPPAAHYDATVQRTVKAALQQRRITVLQDHVALIRSGEVVLGCGTALACDVPLLATGAQAAPWLQGSGLDLDAQGFVAVNACQQSTSHAQVFAAGDVSSRSDRALARSGVYAVRAGPALAKNLAASMAGTPLTEHQPPATTLNLISCGDGKAIASWGRYSAQGRWVWWLKNWIDRRFIKKHSGADI